MHKKPQRGWAASLLAAAAVSLACAAPSLARDIKLTAKPGDFQMCELLPAAEDGVLEGTLQITKQNPHDSWATLASVILARSKSDIVHRLDLVVTRDRKHAEVLSKLQFGADYVQDLLREELAWNERFAFELEWTRDSSIYLGWDEGERLLKISRKPRRLFFMVSSGEAVLSAGTEVKANCGPISD